MLLYNRDLVVNIYQYKNDNQDILMNVVNTSVFYGFSYLIPKDINDCKPFTAKQKMIEGHYMMQVRESLRYCITIRINKLEYLKEHFNRNNEDVSIIRQPLQQYKKLQLKLKPVTFNILEILKYIVDSEKFLFNVLKQYIEKIMYILLFYYLFIYFNVL